MSAYFYRFNYLDKIFFLNVNNRPLLQWNVDVYCKRSHLYLLQLCTWIIFCLFDIHDRLAHSWVSSKGHILFILLCSNPYISNLYILDQNPRLLSHTIGVTYSDYILLLLICEYFRLLQIREDVGICCNKIHAGFPWLSRVTNELEYYLLFQIPNLEPGFAACLYYI